jgi:hypothetical protein
MDGDVYIYAHNKERERESFLLEIASLNLLWRKERIIEWIELSAGCCVRSVL